MRLRLLIALLMAAAVGLSNLSCQNSADDRAGKPSAAARTRQTQDGPATPGDPLPHRVGDASKGREVFRFETFGNEGFWTDAARMPQGMKQAGITPLDALKAGLIVDVDAVPPEMKAVMAKEFNTDLSPQSAPSLNDPMTTVKLIEANAVVGLVPKDSNGDGKINLASGDKVGVSCALCHTISDKSVYDMPGHGSVGKRIDGPAALVLNMGKLLATAANSRALFPNLQLEDDGKTIGRAPKGLTPDSTEAEVDAYLSNPKFYPVGTFDETQDGHGNSVVNQPLFRQDLAAPYGSAGEFALLEDIGNGSYTTNLDPTMLVTPKGREFLRIKAGAAGTKLADGYQKVLDDTEVKGHPYVKASMGHKVGAQASPVGARVDERKLIDMNAYLDSLQAPKGAKVDDAAFTRGQQAFRSNACTSCHNTDQSKAVPTMLVEMRTIMPDYRPEILFQRPPLSSVQNSSGTFDDKMIVVDASDRGEKRGNAMPLLLDLGRKQMFLHDASVSGLNTLLDPGRGPRAPHPFYVKDADQRAAVIQFLRALDTARR